MPEGLFKRTRARALVGRPLVPMKEFYCLAFFGTKIQQQKDFADNEVLIADDDSLAPPRRFSTGRNYPQQQQNHLEASMSENLSTSC